MNRSILLSFDVEEFDMPLEYNQQIKLPEQLEIGRFGLEAIDPILKDKNIAATLFTTATYAINFPNDIRSLAQQHEIASHTFYHSNFKDEHLLSSKLKLEEISLKPVTGLRMPRMRKVAISEVLKAGYTYDSSINPTYLPGRYNNLHLSRTVYNDEGMTRIPASVTPNFRIPLFWLSFKNMPYFLFKNLAIQTLKKDGYICLYFHPWEYADLAGYAAMPFYTRRLSGNPLLEKLTAYLQWLKSLGGFTSFSSTIEYDVNRRVSGHRDNFLCVTHTVLEGTINAFTTSFFCFSNSFNIFKNKLRECSIVIQNFFIRYIKPASKIIIRKSTFYWIVFWFNRLIYRHINISLVV